MYFDFAEAEQVAPTRPLVRLPIKTLKISSSWSSCLSVVLDALAACIVTDYLEQICISGESVGSLPGILVQRLFRRLDSHLTHVTILIHANSHWGGDQGESCGSH